MSAMQLNKVKTFDNLTIPNCITYGGLLFALIGIYLLIKNQIILAIIFLSLINLFDTLDGYVAQKFKLFSPYGGDLDSLVDVLALIIPPFIIASIFDNIPLMISSVFLAGCGIYRFARFNVEKKVPGYVKGFVGSLPPLFIYTAILINITPVYLTIFYFVFGMMMISTVLTKAKYTTYISISIMTLNLIIATISLV